MVIMLTILIGIFTVGLGDKNENGEISAYSVFNRGFQQMLGSVDVENLVAQHVGGALAVQGLEAQRQQEDGDEVIQLRQNGQVVNAGVDDAVARNRHENQEQRQQQRQQRENVPRRSGKKARRRNLELKREMQRQRQAAAAMGFAGNGEEEEIAAMNQLIEDQIFEDE